MPPSGESVLVRLIGDYRAELAGLRAEIASARDELAGLSADLAELRAETRAHRLAVEPLLTAQARLAAAEAARAERGALSERLVGAVLPVAGDWRIWLAVLGIAAAAAGIEVGQILTLLVQPLPLPGVSP